MICSVSCIIASDKHITGHIGDDFYGSDKCQSTEGHLSPVSIQTQSLALHALRALRKRKPQEKQALALASSQSWLPLLRPSIPIGWRLCLLHENFTQQTQAPANRNAWLKQWLPWLAAIAFEWKPGFIHSHSWCYVYRYVFMYTDMFPSINDTFLLILCKWFAQMNTNDSLKNTAGSNYTMYNMVIIL